MLQDAARRRARAAARAPRRAGGPLRRGAGGSPAPPRGGRVRLLRPRRPGRRPFVRSRPSPRGWARRTTTCSCSASAARRWAPRRCSTRSAARRGTSGTTRGASSFPGSPSSRTSTRRTVAAALGPDRPAARAGQRDQQVGRHRGDDGAVPGGARVAGGRRWATRPRVTSCSPPIPSAGALRELAAREGIATLDVPPAVGGRFSVLSPVGLLPAALVGIDIDGAARRARGGRCERAESGRSAAESGRALRRAALGRRHRPRRPHPRAHAVYRPPARPRRLVPPAVGREPGQAGGPRGAGPSTSGPTPVAAVGATDQHSQVQLFMEGPSTRSSPSSGSSDSATTCRSPRRVRAAPSLPCRRTSPTCRAHPGRAAQRGVRGHLRGPGADGADELHPAAAGAHAGQLRRG